MLLGPGSYNANTQKQLSALFTVDCARENFRPSFYTQELFAQRSFYTQTLLHTEIFTHRTYTQKLLHTEAFTQRNFYTKKLLHTETFTHRSFYTQTLFTHRRAILLQFSTIEPNFVRRCCRGYFQIAILPQFLTVEPHFVRKYYRGHLKIAILLQFLYERVI